MFLPVSCHAGDFESGFFGEGGGGPNLAMGMGVGTAHCGTFVFKYLHVGVLLGWGEAGGFGKVRGGGGEVGTVDLGPCFNDGDDGQWGEVCEGPSGCC